MKSEAILTIFSIPFALKASGTKTINDPAAKTKARDGSKTKEIAKIRKYKTKKKLEDNPPVEKITRKITVFKTKTPIGPPRLNFFLLLAERIIKTKTKSPISWGVRSLSPAASKTNINRKEASIRRD